MSNLAPPPVMALLRDHVCTFEHLAILLLLHDTSEQLWLAEAISDQLKIDPGLAETALEQMARGRVLIPVEETGARRYRYNADDPALEESVEWLARDRRDGSLLTVRTLSELAIDRVRTSAMRTFSDAFILRKGPHG